MRTFLGVPSALPRHSLPLHSAPWWLCRPLGLCRTGSASSGLCRRAFCATHAVGAGGSVSAHGELRCVAGAWGLGVTLHLLPKAPACVRGGKGTPRGSLPPVLLCSPWVIFSHSSHTYLCVLWAQEDRHQDSGLTPAVTFPRSWVPTGWKRPVSSASCPSSTFTMVATGRLCCWHLC